MLKKDVKHQLTVVVTDSGVKGHSCVYVGSLTVSVIAEKLNIVKGFSLKIGVILQKVCHFVSRVQQNSFIGFLTFPDL